MNVLPIKRQDAAPWLLEKHYAKSICPISYAFGLFDDGVLVGVVTYGIPQSSTLRDCTCGKEYSTNVIELNRLICNEAKNSASTLVGRSLSMLPKPSVVVSYADTSQGHVGYVYQATNFLYTGLSAKAKNMRVKGMEHLHHATIGNLSRGKENRFEWMRKTYGDDFYLEDRPRKHRYIYFCGNHKQRKDMKKKLKYKIEDYPKGESRRYDAGGEVSTQGLLFS